MVAQAVRVWSVLLALLFAVAIVHKLRVVRDRDAAADPVVRLYALSAGHPAGSLLIACVVEAVTAASLMRSPLLGFGLATCVLAVYAVALKRLAPDEPCNCFGAALRAQSRSSAIMRNVALAAASAAAWLAYAAGLPVSALSQTVIGTALLVAAGVAAADAVRRMSAAAPSAAWNGEEGAG